MPRLFPPILPLSRHANVHAPKPEHLVPRAVGTDSVDIGIRLSSCAVRSGFSYEAGTGFFLLLEPAALAGCDPQPSVRFP